MLNAKITGIASYVPDYVLTNDELSQMVDTNDEWITTRVGIKERRILKGEGLGSSYMGKIAVDRLLASTGTKKEEVDLVICATSNPDYRFPSTASIIAHKCGLSNCYAYDIQAACAGFIVTLQAANAYIRSGLYKKVIVVAAEMMSSMTNYEDRTTCPLFGDAAAAVMVEPTEEEGIGVIDGVFHVDGEGLSHLVMKAGGSAYPASHATIDAHEHFVYQEGRAVYKHAVTDMLTSSLDVMKRNNLTVNDVDWFVPHQANLRIIEAVGERIGIPAEKILVNIQYRGNTSAASIPLCLDENKDKLKKGDKIVLTAFGAGFTWGATYLVWGY
ncbi:MAG TPA: ketoacyl-ACP synthase III [Candidatus Limisoma intestinavium]|uniref:Beta-ketoacyl-[acyl-carrier-protein] synthase III n=1 Tax=Candidatus Limisoma intestinavium TaxID=2840856 RepID=A0A9D1IK52_9BACT|nr:ketoacyl-ACP synthase III [Candidatus Limisoma intestinavium]